MKRIDRLSRDLKQAQEEKKDVLQKLMNVESMLMQAQRDINSKNEQVRMEADNRY